MRSSLSPCTTHAQYVVSSAWRCFCKSRFICNTQNSLEFVRRLQLLILHMKFTGNYPCVCLTLQVEYCVCVLGGQAGGRAPRGGRGRGGGEPSFIAVPVSCCSKVAVYPTDSRTPADPMASPSAALQAVSCTRHDSCSISTETCAAQARSPTARTALSSAPTAAASSTAAAAWTFASVAFAADRKLTSWLQLLWHAQRQRLPHRFRWPRSPQRTSPRVHCGRRPLPPQQPQTPRLRHPFSWPHLP